MAAKINKRLRRGAIAIEFALLAPVLLLIFGGVFDTSRYIWYQSDILQALRAGMQSAMTDPSNTTQITNSVKGSTALSTSSNWVMPTPDCGCTAMTDATNMPSSWGSCSAVPCTGSRKYMRLQASYAYTPLVGRMVGLLPATASYITYMRVQ